MFEVDMESVPLSDLEVELCNWAGRISAATCHWLTLVAAFDRRDGWSKAGMPTCAHWLAWRCGLGLRASYEYLRVARSIEKLPRTRELFARGEISYSKVRAISRVAEAGTEENWLAQASRRTASQLERLVSSHLQLNRKPADDDQNDHQRKLRCSWHWNEDGTFSLSARLDAERGAVMQNALMMALASLRETGRRVPAQGNSPVGRSDDERDGSVRGESGARPERVEAIAAMAEGFLSSGAPTLSDPATHTVNVHVDIETLTGLSRKNEKDASHHSEDSPRDAAADRRCDVAAGISLPPHVARRLSCDSLLRTLVTDGDNNPLALGRTRRSPTTKVRQAVFARDRGRCQYPGCENTRWLEVHHLLEWTAHRGDTDPVNLALICSLHHRVIHRDGVVLYRGRDGTLYARHRNGTVTRQAPGLSPGAEPLLHAQRLHDAFRGTDEVRRAA